MSALPRTSAEARGAPARRIVVGVADLAASRDAGASLVTYALGSCLGVTIHDPVARVGAMLHVMLPDSAIDPAKAAANPAMFVDTGIPRLLREACRLGAVKERMVVKVAGGAAVWGGDDLFEIGRRNMDAFRRVLARQRLVIASLDVAGCAARTVTLDVATGRVMLRIDGADRCL